MIRFNVTITEAGMGDVTYTGITMKDGESKGAMMGRIIDDHRFIFAVPTDVEITATARIDR